MRLRWSVAVSGTHGKTTTTSLVATLLNSAEIDPTVINGGMMAVWGSLARLANGTWMVVESDESDVSLAKLKPTVAVVTNIDPQPLFHDRRSEAFESAFVNCVASYPMYGLATLCIDYPSVQRLLSEIKVLRFITYGLSATAAVRASNIRVHQGAMLFDLGLANRLQGDSAALQKIRLSLRGDHNVQKCLSAIGVALEMNIDASRILGALAESRRDGRKGDTKAVTNGVTPIHHSGPHPVEIRAALKAG